MKPKKNQKHNINRNSTFYFSMGLTLVLLLTYIALEWKTYKTNEDWDISILGPSENTEDVPITIYQPKLPPPPKMIKIPPVIEIAEDDDDIIETLIESTESDGNTEIIEIDSVVVLNEALDEDIPFMVIEEVPVFPGCEMEKDKRSCFQEMMNKHVRKNFRYPEVAKSMELQGRVFVRFTIQKDGSIGDIQMRGPDIILEEEAGRIISRLPKMIPGKQRGKAVNVPFSMPIVFRLQ
ncbi:MAG: energy transducer TonB [Flavobacteriaceae bacterium]